MGNLTAKQVEEEGFPPLLEETQIFALWTINDARELLKRFHSQVHGFALVEAQFESIISFKASVADHVALDELFDILDNDHDGRIDGLELLGGIALCCQGTFEDKARFCFELFDFNLNSFLSRKELIMMMMSSICGMILLTGGGEDLEPELTVVERLAEDALLRADVNGDGQISYEEFVYWARSNRILMAGLETLKRVALEAKVDIQSDDSAPEASDIEDETVSLKDILDVSQVQSGDQSTAVVPWLSQIHEPTNFKLRKSNGKGPETNLEIAWAFGYRSSGNSGKVRYLRSIVLNSTYIIYAAAAVSVIYNPQARTQHFYLGHSCEITALETHPNQQIVSTADKQSNVHIWTLDSTGKPMSLVVFQSIVKSGIRLLCFSPKGDKIALVGLDSDQTICIHDVNSGRLISSAKGMSYPAVVYDIAYSKSGNEIALAGKNQIKFFTGVDSQKRAIDYKIGRIGNQGKRQPFYCVVYLKEDALIGCANGEIYRFRDGICISMIQAHGVKESVQCLYCNDSNGTILSGGKDGTIKTWDSTLKEVGVAIDLTEDLDGDGRVDSGSIDSAVVSVQQYQDRVLVSTKGCDIFEALLPSNPAQHHTMSRIAWGHSSGELWGLAVHPTTDEICTVGDDKTIRLWSLKSKEQINIRIMPESSRAVAYSYSGNIICVGLVDGSLNLMDRATSNLRVYSTWKHSAKVINDIKFSANDEFLAVASADTNIYLYKKSIDGKTYMRQAVCRGHSGGVTHLDFSANSQYIQSNGTDYSILYWDVTGNQIKQTSTMRDIIWSTMTCVLGWCVQGIHKSSDITNVNSCMALPDIGDIVTGDDFGRVTLYKYPAIAKSAIHQSYLGHASHVTTVRFTWNKRYVVSTGGLDRTIIVWKHAVELEDSDVEDNNYNSSASSGNDVTNISSKHDIPDVQPRSLQQEAASLGWTMSELKEFMSKKSKFTMPGNRLGFPTGGDQSNAAVLPWKSSIIEPTKWTPMNSSTDVDLSLEWVFGHRSADCRNNVLYSAEGSIVFNAANLAIVYHKPSGKQQILTGSHVDEVISIAPHPAGQIFATGAAGREAGVVVWNSKDMNVLTKLENCHERGVALLGFNTTGNLLASIGLDENNSFCIHDWSKGILILRTSTHTDRILSCAFIRNEQSNTPIELDKVAVDNRDIFVTGGKRFLKFWWWQGQNIQSQSAIWGNVVKERKSAILCIASASKDICITGTSTGNLLIWQNFKLINQVREFMDIHASKPTSVDAVDLVESGPIIAPVFFPKGGYPHQNSVVSIWGIPGDISLAHEIDDCFDNYVRANKYITADRNGVICVWRLVNFLGNSNSGESVTSLFLLKLFKLQELKPLPFGTSVKSICERDGVILIGTNSGEIIEVLDDSVAFVDYSDAPIIEKLNQRSASLEVIGGVTIPASFISVNHNSQEIWALACHPYMSIFVTGGDDHYIRCWSLSSRRQISLFKLSDKIRAVDIRPTDAQDIAIGTFSGKVYIVPMEWLLNPDDKPEFRNAIDTKLFGKDVSEKLENSKVITLSCGSDFVKVLKYSFDGSILAAGSHDFKIYVFDVQDKYKLKYEFAGHTGMPLHIDFGVILKVNHTTEEVKDSVHTRTEVSESYDSSSRKIVLHTSVTTTDVLKNVTTKKLPRTERNLAPADVCVQTCSKSGELLFWKALDGTKISALSTVKDAWWATMSSCYGWPVQGIWSPLEVDQDIKIFGVARSHSYEKVPVLATADNYGRVRLFNYPCVQPGAPDKCYRGHSGIIADIQFSYDDKYCITIGGSDRCIFVWSTDIEDEMRERLASATISNFKSIGYVTADEVEEEQFVAVEDEDLSIKKFFPTIGDEFMAIKPWKGAIREPTDWKDHSQVGSIPQASLELKYIHGYRGWDCRNNLAFADAAHSIVYHIAGVGVVLNTHEHRQILNTEHDDDILCLAVHPDGHTIATGEIGKFPKIVLWDANTGVTVRTIVYHKRGVSNVLFSNDGERIISCGMDDDRTIAVHHVKTGNLLGKGKVGKGIEVYCMNTSGENFVTGGKNHVKFWELPPIKSVGGELPSKAGLYYLKTVKVRTATSCAFLGSDAVTGMVDGSLLLWKERSNTKVVVSAHTSAVTAMHAIEPAAGGTVDGRNVGPRIVTGGRDGFIHMWDMQFNKLWTMDLNTTSPASACPQIQALFTRHNRLLIGTKAAEIYEVGLLGSSESILHVQSHYIERAELWGLAVHPKLARFVTCGDDMTVRLWDAKLCKQLKVTNIGMKARAIAYHPDGSQIAIALMDGKLLILSEDLEKILNTILLSSDWVQALNYSPDGRLLAVGSHDRIIYLLETKSFSCQAKCKGHNSFLTAVDFSDDSTRLQSVSGDYELLFWDTHSGKQITSPSDTRDVKWATSTCTLGWAVQGVWPPNADGSDINSIDRSPSLPNKPVLLVTGDDYKLVKLFTYPSCKENAQFRAYKGHSEHVMRVKFSACGKYVYSVGGLDKAIMQFEVQFQ